MTVTKEFMDAVQLGKEMRVRIMLKDSLLVDPTATQFNKMEHYANSEMGNIYMKHDDEKLNFDVAAWNENYLNVQMVNVVNNFSEERIELLKSMVRYLYKDKASKIRSERDNRQSTHKFSRKQVGTGVTVSGAILAVAGICASHTVITIGGAVVAATGVVLIISDKVND